MAYSPIDVLLLKAGKAIKESILNQINGNLENHESRINNLSSGGGKVNIFNKIIDLETGRVGTIAHSLLTEAQYLERHGSNWNLIKSQDLTGKDLAALYGSTTAPTSLGRTLRSYNNGSGVNPDNTTIGGIQDDQIESHSHTTTVNLVNGGSDGRNLLKGSNYNTVDTVKAMPNTGAVGGNETRGKSLTVNTFIKENDLDFSTMEIMRAYSNMSIVSATVSNLDAGTSGTLSVDLLKGSSLASMSTALNAPMTLDSAAGDNALSAEADFLDNQLSQNEFIKLHLNSVQKHQSRFFVSVYAEAI
ncbi:MAG: hypothetical protein ACPGJV_02535 [Bacteriovoracaceae bacterium]